MLGLRIALMSLALASCGKGEVVSEPLATDAMPIVAIDAYAPLVGTWSASMQIDSVGLVTGVATIDASGRGTFFVSAGGASKSGSFAILALANGRVRVRALGVEHSAPITIEENQLRLQITGVGEVVGTRSKS